VAVTAPATLIFWTLTVLVEALKIRRSHWVLAESQQKPRTS